MKIAILGYGTVGSGLIDLIENNTSKRDIEVVGILVKNKEKHKYKKYFDKITTDIEDIFDKDIDILVEVIGGLNPAFDYVTRALNKKIHVVTANKDLLAGERIIDVAFKYGYESTDGFTRAFKKWSGLLPSDVIKKKRSKMFPKFSFKIVVTGGITMEFRIENKSSFNFFGISKRIPMQFEGVNKEVVKLIQSITEEQKKEMRELQNIAPYEILNISYDADAKFMKEEGDLTHMIGVMSTREMSKQLEKLPVEAGLWAVFPNEGLFPSTLQQTWARIYSEWLLSSNYELIDKPSFSFTKMDELKKDFAYSEIWIPIKEK